MTKTVFPIPVNYLGMVLGLAGIGLAWRYATTILAISHLIGESILAIATLIWASLISVYCYKWLKYPELAKAELAHPIMGCFVSLTMITSLLIAIAIQPYSPLSSYILLVAGIIGQIGFAMLRIGKLWKGNHPTEATTPVLYLPLVALNFVSANALEMAGQSELGMIFLGAGVFSWLCLEPAVQQRLRNLESVPPAVRPVLGIQFAPAFVCRSAYFSLNGGKIDSFVYLLIGYGLLQFLLLAKLLPWIMQNGLSMGLWSFSFGSASMAGVGLHFYHELSDKLIAMLGIAMFIIGSVIILALALMTLYLIATNRFLLK
ncbi:dicarboxylate transporter/tellurite-resistance protein TehA [Actinobacillus arthritidis]|uniref:dicarboxylate transporter/tellurite-resistance protein TehA n=1 Tax=Actinobacillus arthritidis TaxID=157339 RepID=UPI002443663C|nr:dicarboxylate transporter/tellurite-resistance protein TehA [Actinobacillus arthritidis]WGE88710.1 dicarboxylate transporter/tellurite-resistance protein TehA [Actinobacillus arthritidis]